MLAVYYAGVYCWSMELLKAYRNLKNELVNNLGITESQARKRILRQIRADKFDKRHT